jgi:hypothetical protein
MKLSPRVGVGQGAVMDWARILAYVTGTVDQALLARNEYLAVENRIIKAQLTGRLKQSRAVSSLPLRHAPQSGRSHVRSWPFPEEISEADDVRSQA